MAALQAGKAIMEVYNGPIAVVYKDDASPLTLADERSNTIINSFLDVTGIPVISEENKAIDYVTRKDWDTCWIIDPVDGTKEFIKRNGEFTVNIALVKDGIPQLGVIYVPVSQTLYFADVSTYRSYKAVLKGHDISFDEVMAVASLIQPRQQHDDKVIVVGSRSHMNTATEQFIEALKERGKTVEIVSKGSSLKFCLVAEGYADIYPRFAPTMEWDTAAGQAICNAVGVTVISQKTNTTLEYNKQELLNPWFIVQLT
jgi:3'(2'), 5'-bisphosphate nucleotidase